MIEVFLIAIGIGAVLFLFIGMALYAKIVLDEDGDEK